MCQIEAYHTHPFPGLYFGSLPSPPSKIHVLDPPRLYCNASQGSAHVPAHPWPFIQPVLHSRVGLKTMCSPSCRYNTHISVNLHQAPFISPWRRYPPFAHIAAIVFHWPVGQVQGFISDALLWLYHVNLTKDFFPPMAPRFPALSIFIYYIYTTI